MKHKKFLHVIGTFTICFMLTGCCMSHEWKEATCTEPKTCSKCNETEGEALGHTWADATCAKPKTCTVCGEVEGEALAHTWVDATCAEPKHCSVCGETEGEPLEHTLTEANYQQSATCEVCGETVGEPLQADLINVPLNLVELNQTFDYVRPCSAEPSETTITQAVFKDYSCLISDDTHEAVDGYVWQTVTFEMKMNDYNGWMYGGKGTRSATVSYYDMVGFDESHNDNIFSVNFYGKDYSDCLETSTISWSGWDSDNWNDNYPPCNTLTWHYECRVPEGYDGIVMLLASDNLNDTLELLDADNQDKVDYSFRLPAAIPE